jgi:monofunctional biosynthetic peptidoglycan transglycosylase
MFKKLILIPLLILVVGFMLHIGYYCFFPDVSALKRNNPKKTAFMEYREKQWQEEGKRKKLQQRWVYLPQISPDAIKAVIIAEDDKFWKHEGFDFQAMQKALEKDIKKKTFKAGGSTISQQLVKNLYLSPSKNPVRKLKEAILTWRIEQKLSKKRIIELYLNVAEWGDGLFGIELAAQHYFGKPASALTAREGAKLAAVLPNPLKFNPAGDSKYVAGRSERIYQIMVKRGIVIPEFEEMMKEKTDELDVLGSDPERIRKLEEQVKTWKKEAENSSAKTGGKRSEPDREDHEKGAEAP